MQITNYPPSNWWIDSWILISQNVGFPSRLWGGWQYLGPIRCANRVNSERTAVRIRGPSSSSFSRSPSLFSYNNREVRKIIKKQNEKFLGNEKCILNHLWWIILIFNILSVSSMHMSTFVSSSFVLNVLFSILVFSIWLITLPAHVCCCDVLNRIYFFL